MIQVERLTKRYGSRTAVRDVSFEVQKGEIVGFLGPNGAGKSTTLRMITGYLHPTGGRVRIDGIDAFERPIEARRLFGYMPEGVPLYEEMRVFEYLRYRGELKGLPSKALGDAVERALDQAGVVDARERIIGQLSKGYRQRVGLADALIADPPLLILDEPSSGLDPNQIRQMRALIRGFAGKKTVFLSTHILPEVEATCERVVILHGGRKVGEGKPGELRGGERQVVRLAGPGDRAAFARAVDGVDGVLGVTFPEPMAGSEPAAGPESTAGMIAMRIETEARPAIVDALFRAVADAGLTLRELRTEAASLEDVFTKLTTEEEAADGASGADDAPEGGDS